MRDFATSVGFFAFCAMAVWLLVAAVSWITWYFARQRAARRVEREANTAKLLALMERLDGCYAMIRSLERNIRTLDKLSAFLTSQQRKLEALAPSAKEPSSG